MKMFEELRKNDKKGLFDKECIDLFGYSTKFAPFDYFNGYKVMVQTSDKVERAWWANVGLFSGTFITVAGNTSTAKTSFCVQAAANIVRDIPNAGMIFFDIEGSANISRIQTLTGFTTEEEWDEKVSVFQKKVYIEDVFTMIKKMANYRIEHRNELLYETGRLNEFGEPIKMIAPLVVIIDSIPMFVTKEADEEGGDGSEMMGLTYSARVARMLNQFYTRLRPVISEANIIVMAVNHIKPKIETGFKKTQAQIMYMDQDKYMSGGKAPMYLAHNVFEFICNGKYKEDVDGFDGFLIRCESRKSRSSKGGKYCYLVFDQETGFDIWKTLLKFIESKELISGRNPYKYFVGHEDFKFDSRKIAELCCNEEFRQKILEVVKEPLENLLSSRKEKMNEFLEGAVQ